MDVEPLGLTAGEAIGHDLKLLPHGLQVVQALLKPPKYNQRDETQQKRDQPSGLFARAQKLENYSFCGRKTREGPADWQVGCFPSALLGEA